MTSHTKQPPQAVGLYDPRFEHDACGVGMVARLDNRPTHEVVARAITALENLEHRGASGADPCTGDGAGILMQMPDELLRAVVDFELPPRGRLRRADVLPADRRRGARRASRSCSSGPSRAEGQRVLGWRDVPVAPGAHRRGRRRLPPGDPPAVRRRGAAQRARPGRVRAQALRDPPRLRADAPQEPGLYVASSSSRTINYKGMLISYQLAAVLPRPARRAHQERARARALALLDQHLPELGARAPLPRDLPQRRDQHADGQRQLDARARERAARGAVRRGPARRSCRSSAPGNSDSATFDNVLELLMLAGRSLPHAAMMMIPEAYRDRDDLPEDLKGFYAFHSCLMEPWDGPASVAFTDGRVVGATLDRNGLRPGRWVETTDGHVVLGSEIGLLDIPAEQVRRLGRLQPGKLFLVDLERGRIVEDEEVKREVATQPALRRVVRAQRRALLRAAALRTGDALRSAAAPAPARVRLHPGGPARAARRRWRARAPSRSARWATTSRWRCSPTRRRRCSPTSSSCSPRSPTRRSTRSARKS